MVAIALSTNHQICYLYLQVNSAGLFEEVAPLTSVESVGVEPTSTHKSAILPTGAEVCN